MAIKTEEEARRAFENWLRRVGVEDVDIGAVFDEVKRRGYQHLQLVTVAIATVAGMQAGHDLDSALRIGVQTLNERAMPFGVPPIPYYPPSEVKEGR